MGKYELVIFSSFCMIKNYLFKLINELYMIFMNKNINPVIMKLFV
jgi:hypothetical protein